MTSQPTFNAANSKTIVLVTGGGGFIGSHCIHQLLAQGYTVRTTVRSLSRESSIRKLVTGDSKDQSEYNSRLSFFEADLLKDEGWNEAIKGCKYVLHVASPFPLSNPKDENELIKPAKEGTLRVMKSAKEAGVERVVLTSSFAAVGYGHPDSEKSKILDEKIWTNTDIDSGIPVPAYQKSKTLAEKAAWEFIENQSESNRKLELSVINPVAVFGPILGSESGRDLGSSVSIVSAIAQGKIPIVPRLSFGIVDVRDVAALHLIAMTHPKASGERFLTISDHGEFLYLKEIAEACGRAPATIPDWVIRLASYVISDISLLLSDIGEKRLVSNEKARSVLGYEFIPWQDAVKATVDSLKKYELLK